MGRGRVNDQGGTHTKKAHRAAQPVKFRTKLSWQCSTKALNLLLKAARDDDDSRFPRITLLQQLLVVLSRLKAENVSPTDAKLERMQLTRNESHY